MAFSLLMLSALVASAYCGVLQPAGLGLVNAGLYNNGFYAQPTVGLAKAAPVGVVNQGFYAQPTVGLAKAAPVGLVNQGFYAQPTVAVKQPLAKVAQPAVFAYPANAGFVNVQPSLAKVPATSYGYPVNGFLNKAPAVAVKTPTFVQTPAVVKTPAFVQTPVAVKTPAFGLGFGKLPSFAQNVPTFVNNGLGFGSFKNFGFNKAPVKQVVNTFPAVKAPVVNTFVKQPVQTVIRAAPSQLTAVNKNLLPAHLPAQGQVVGVQSALGALPVGVNTLGYVQPKVQQVLPVAQFPVAQGFVKQPVVNTVAKAPATFVSSFPKQTLATKAVVVPQNVVPDVLNVPALSLQKTGASAGSPNSDFGDFAGFGIDGGFKLLDSDNKNIFGQF